MPPTPKPRDALIALARAAAAAHSLDPALVCAVVEQESAWNPWAIRSEPGFLTRYVAPLFTTGKISSTEAYARSFSWGLMQVMGQVAREHEFSDASLAQLCDPPTGLEIGCRVLAHKFAAAVSSLPVGCEQLSVPTGCDLLQPCGDLKTSQPRGASNESANKSAASACPECGQNIPSAAPPSGSAVIPRRPAAEAVPAVIQRALQLWNGGANPDYAAQVLARLPRYAV